jgi:16S rRNA (guanine527-N7)-methyltransferase
VEIVTARACAPLPRLFGYALPLMRGGARGLFLKGRSAEAELAEARRSWRVEATLTPSRSDPEGRIVVVERLSRGRR